MDFGLQSLIIIAGYHGIAVDEGALRHEFGEGAFSDETILLAAKMIGMTGKVVRREAQRLNKAPLPVIVTDKGGRYFIAARYDEAAVGGPRLLIQRPGEPPSVLGLADFIAVWSGKSIFLASKAHYSGELARFDFSWFIPAIVKYRRLLAEVVVISLVLQIVALATPLFFQVVMDKVLVNHAMTTLNVIAIGLIAATVFETLLTGIRSYVFAHTSSKIDVELGARLFRHLLGLPIAYFQSRRVGDSVARVRELENIRAFLTGNAVTLLMDLLFSTVFLGVMLLYSGRLTLIVVLSIPLYVALSMLFTPMLRARLNQKFNRGAESQAFMVESISNIDTIKTMAVEPRWAGDWEKQLASYVTTSLAANNIAMAASGGVNLVGKLVTAAIMWVGASLVIDGKLTVGELIAFNMLAGRVSAPVLRLAQLWNDFQQVGVSMGRMGDILNARVESVGKRTRLPSISGEVDFDQVTFRYRSEAADAVRRLSLKIKPGEIIGIVGRSGSGKSTLVRLLQRMYVPDQGRVLIDGQDIAIIDTASLRMQVGVVSQEAILFNRSIRENISLANPALRIEDVIEVAKVAGAHEFICELAEGYDTKLSEQGVGLSGGQRQRIAIARALIRNPRILIFDEATSALDYESERVIQRNMKIICRNRTVLIVAHRLSAVMGADRIIVMERGEIIEQGSHTKLIGTKDGAYHRLYGMQLQGDSERVGVSA